MPNVNSVIKDIKNKIASIISSNETWATLSIVCEKLRLKNFDSENISKYNYVLQLINQLNDKQIILLTKEILINYPSDRHKLENSEIQVLSDLLSWFENDGIQRITNVTRNKMVESLEGIQFWGRVDLSLLFNPVLPQNNIVGSCTIGSDGNIYIYNNLDILDVFFSNKKNISNKLIRITHFDFFQQLGVLNWPDKRFCLVIERLLHPEVQYKKNQQILLKNFTELLLKDGFQIVQIDEEGGEPIYSIQELQKSVSGLIKYIIFASTDKKPDIVLTDSLNMDIEVVNKEKTCIVYDQPPTNEGLSWQTLLNWWGKKEGVDVSEEQNRKQFGLRLRASLQSEPEKILFDTYFKELKKVFGDNLPALLPQVYLHYDPKNKFERMQPILFRQRIDFLLLLRNSVRIILEIDGKQHYSDNNGYAQPRFYADMVSEDRRVKLLGYEIFRFGGIEFCEGNKTEEIIVDFFKALFYRFGIKS